MKLFIVESPSKCGKLKSILGKDYKVMPPVGHVRSIPHKGLNSSLEKCDKTLFVNGFIKFKEGRYYV